jgi:hypothetical protein
MILLAGYQNEYFVVTEFFYLSYWPLSASWLMISLNIIAKLIVVQWLMLRI